MTTVSIHAISLDSGSTSYRAVAGEQFCVGRSPGEALDLITAQIGSPPTSTLVVLQNNLPDAFFSAEQVEELADLMQRWRAARDHDQPFSADDQAKLASLIEAELQASTQRASALADESGK